MRAVIPERRDQQDRRHRRPGRPLHFDRAAYRQRNVIERAVGWLKERRRLATRYEKLAIQYLAMLYVGLIERYLSTLFANTAWCDVPEISCAMRVTLPRMLSAVAVQAKGRAPSL